MSKKIVRALYDDDDVLLSAVRKVRENNYNIEEVYTPFPVHGLDKVMGLKKTRLAIASFIYGCIGLLVATLMLKYIMIDDWPRNIGGKPNFTFIENLPSFVPIMFELTVFFAAHLMVLTFFFRSKLWPYKKAENPDPRTTDDHFLMEVLVEENSPEDIVEFMSSTGAVEINLCEKQ